MTLSEIKAAVDNGIAVYWKNGLYVVVKDRNNSYLITCSLNDYCIGLTWSDGVTLNGEECDFFINKD